MLWQMIDTTEVRLADFLGFADVRVVAMARLEAFERPVATSEVVPLRETMPHLRSRLPVGTPGAGKVENVYHLLEACIEDSFEQFLQAEKK
ncbi:hypothetical protein TGAMA5MH_07972 [Trichoderma gamsii]|uniref:Uncharacterized protein n=1 Tax=Trichoderma gamsii TaxID=398673 RepID=A0A2K0T3F4_9HYPO|nr:hypothetical protein TGAMA5MH_07972 [Trichoderma gamsii]